MFLTLLYRLIGVMISLANAAGTDDIPAQCQRLLLELPMEGTRHPFDWKPIVAQMEASNFLIKDASISTGQLRWSPAVVLDRIRDSIDDPDWFWDEPLNADKSFAIGYHWSFDPLHILPLSYLSGFNALAATQGFLAGRPRDSVLLKVSDLALTASVWAKGPEGLSLVAEILNSAGPCDWPGVAMLLDHVPRTERHRFWEKAVRDRSAWSKVHSFNGEPRWILSAVALAPADLRWSPIARAEKDRWIDLNRHPAVTIETARHFAYFPAQAGRCRDMSTGHLSILTHPERSRVIHVYLRGYLIGWIKFSGNRSFLALRNVTDTSGRLILTMGGVYHLTNDFPIPRADVSQFPVTKIHLDEIAARPTSFVLNAVALRENASLIHAVTSRYLSEAASATQLESWFAFLEALRDYRTTHEPPQDARVDHLTREGTASK